MLLVGKHKTEPWGLCYLLVPFSLISNKLMIFSAYKKKLGYDLWDSYPPKVLWFDSKLSLLLLHLFTSTGEDHSGAQDFQLLSSILIRGKPLVVHFPFSSFCHCIVASWPWKTKLVQLFKLRAHETGPIFALLL